jgi:type IV secretory pathway protease TraF
MQQAAKSAVVATVSIASVKLSLAALTKCIPLLSMVLFASASVLGLVSFVAKRLEKEFFVDFDSKTELLKSKRY